MRNISSVSKSKLKKSKALLFLIIGVLIAVLGNVLFGGLVIVLGIVLHTMIKDKYAVKIQTNSGTAEVLISTNEDYIEKVISAINESVIQRG